MKLRDYLGVKWKDIPEEEQDLLLEKFWYWTTKDAAPMPTPNDKGCILEFMDESDDDYALSIGGFDNSTEDQEMIEIDENEKLYNSDPYKKGGKNHEQTRRNCRRHDTGNRNGETLHKTSV